MAKRRKIKRRVRIKQNAQLVHKNDKTTVTRAKYLDTIPRMEAQPPRSMGTVFKVKIRKKQ